MTSIKRHRAAVWLTFLLALVSCGATFGPTGQRYATIAGGNVNSTVLAWADKINGYPSQGVVLDPVGNVTPGTTTTSGSVGSSIKVKCPWYSAKKGVANTVGTNPISHQASHDAIAALSPTLSWFYNYGPTPWSYVYYNLSPATDLGPSLTIPDGLQFIPMFLDGSHVNATELAAAQPWVTLAGAVIGPNEPYGEGNMTPAQVIAIWPQLMALGGRTVAPSIGYHDPTAQTWLSTFMGLIASNGYTVDVLNFHATMGLYDGSIDPVASAGTFFTDLDAMHTAYPAYPIWVTEFQFFTNSISQLETLWDNILTGLEARSFVEKYASWPLGTDPTRPGGADFDQLSLCDANGNLTATGKLYSSYTKKY